jgi:hypothetical protein
MKRKAAAANSLVRVVTTLTDEPKLHKPKAKAGRGGGGNTHRGRATAHLNPQRQQHQHQNQHRNPQHRAGGSINNRTTTATGTTGVDGNGALAASTVITDLGIEWTIPSFDSMWGKTICSKEERAFDGAWRIVMALREDAEYVMLALQFSADAAAGGVAGGADPAAIELLPIQWSLEISLAADGSVGGAGSADTITSSAVAGAAAAAAEIIAPPPVLDPVAGSTEVGLPAANDGAEPTGKVGDAQLMHTPSSAAAALAAATAATPTSTAILRNGTTSFALSPGPQHTCEQSGCRQFCSTAYLKQHLGAYRSEGGSVTVRAHLAALPTMGADERLDDEMDNTGHQLKKSRGGSVGNGSNRSRTDRAEGGEMFFPRHTVVAVRNVEGRFWLAQLVEELNPLSDADVEVQWFEGVDRSPGLYRFTNVVDSVSAAAIHPAAVELVRQDADWMLVDAGMMERLELKYTDAH